MEEQRRQKLSGFIVEVDRRADAEPDLDKRVEILREAVERFPDEEHFQRALRLARDKRDLVNSIVAKARRLEERSSSARRWRSGRSCARSTPSTRGWSSKWSGCASGADQQARADAKARWVERIDRHLEVGRVHSARWTCCADALAEFPGDPELAELVKLARRGWNVAPNRSRHMEEGQRLWPRAGSGRGAGGAGQGLRPGAAQPGDARRAGGNRW